MVKTQASIMLPATPQRTALRRRVAPTPMIAPETTWVVETGRPTTEAEKTVMAAAVSDAAITASVNAELAKDSKLSSLKIDVDTSHGHVALKGTAPDAASKERATQIASAVKGVTSVDNQLRVENS